jgi:hypothetical protein
MQLVDCRFEIPMELDIEVTLRPPTSGSLFKRKLITTDGLRPE